MVLAWGFHPEMGLESMTCASVIICTRDRENALLTCLESVARSALAARPASVEVIVVDDGSSDASADVVLAFAARSVTPILLLRQDRLGLSAARNAGVRAANGQLLIFIDDDCVVSQAHVADALELFSADRQWVLRGGRVELGDEQDAPLTIRVGEVTERLQRGVDPAGFILGCNMAAPRDLFDCIGLFDERLGAGSSLGSAEDSDFVLRTWLAGFPVEYVHDRMSVFHHHGRRSRAQIEAAQRNYSIGNGALMTKHLWRAPWLLRRCWWTLRNALREKAGGPLFDERLGLSHGPMFWQNLEGARQFIALKMRRTLQGGGHGRRGSVIPNERAKGLASGQPERVQ